ncbi:hypothetical protein ACIBG0_19740 [Nocardia sp. NPDC050630]|uniref:hypothetical protein n=1 Tax=Nocardia sp. NPDC050630 TaxID=3364321 RepID=UPI0037A40D8C
MPATMPASLRRVDYLRRNTAIAWRAGVTARMCVAVLAVRVISTMMTHWIPRLSKLPIEVNG